jgi:hypothetical protein
VDVLDKESGRKPERTVVQEHSQGGDAPDGVEKGQVS